MSGGNENLPVLVVVIFVMLMLYVIIGTYMEHKHASFGHETGVALVVGLIISAIVHYQYKEVDVTFNGDIFFYVCLPPIIFAAGFNMRRRRFFENIGYVLTFGIVGTIITFFVFAGLTSLISNMHLIRNSHNELGYIQLDLIESFLIASLLCSSDVIAAISIVKYEEQPKLFSIIFGEGIVNDAVALILFQTVSALKKNIDEHVVISAVKLPFAILLNFVILGLGSISIGLVCGLLASYIFKSQRFLTVSAIKEVLLIFSFGYLAYGLGEIAHMSGIICLLTTGVIFAHYGWFNLSPQGKHLSSATFQVIGFALEAFVFCYLGLSFFSFVDKEWSWQFVLLEGLVCIIARFIGTVGLIQLMRLLSHNATITFKDQLFICYAGLIRGAIAFGLVLRLSGIITDEVKLGIIETTALTLVVSTTLIFGSTMSMVQRALLSELSEDQIIEQLMNESDLGEDQAENLQKELESKMSMIEDAEIPKQKSEKKDQGKKQVGNINKTAEAAKEKGKKNARKSSQGSVNESVDHFEEFLHPNLRNSKANEVRETIETRRKNFNSCKNCFRRFDELIMKPLFIYKYDRELVNKKAEFMEMFMHEADVWEKAYIKEDFDPKELEEQRVQRGQSILNRISMMSRKQSNLRMSVRSISAGNFGPRRLSQNPSTPMGIPSQTLKTSIGQPNTGVISSGAFSPKSEKRIIQPQPPMMPHSMGNRSPLMGARANMIDKIDEENSDNEGEGGNSSTLLGKNNYKKMKTENQKQF